MPNQRNVSGAVLKQHIQCVNCNWKYILKIVFGTYAVISRIISLSDRIQIVPIAPKSGGEKRNQQTRFFPKHARDYRLILECKMVIIFAISLSPLWGFEDNCYRVGNRSCSASIYICSQTTITNQCTRRKHRKPWNARMFKVEHFL